MGILWLIAVATGLVMLTHYGNSPGSAGQVPRQWPTDSKIVLSDHGATLVMFVHPHCPCTRASLEELERLVTSCHGVVTPWVVFFKPVDTDDDWDQTDLWRTAAAIADTHVLRDVDGHEARRFDAATSGYTLLYDKHGKLLFDGGITSARGHSGDNDGRSAIESILIDNSPGARQTPVFGCPIIPTLEPK